MGVLSPAIYAGRGSHSGLAFGPSWHCCARSLETTIWSMYLQALACLMAQPSRESISLPILNSVRFLYCTRLEPARAGITARIILSFSIRLLLVFLQEFAADPR